jgi:hypothetical protein
MMIAGHRTGWLQRTDEVNKNGTRVYRMLKRPPEDDDLVTADWDALAGSPCPIARLPWLRATCRAGAGHNTAEDAAPLLEDPIRSLTLPVMRHPLDVERTISRLPSFAVRAVRR